MKRLSVTILALGLATAGAASAQSYGYGNNYNNNNGYNNSNNTYGQPSVDRYGQTNGATYDYARVIRVDRVTGYNNNSYNNNNYNNSGYSGTRGYSDPYAQQGGYYGNDRYRNNNGYSSRDPYYPQQQSRYGGSNTGATVATVLGGIAGAVLGSKVGGGSGTYAASALGSMVGGMAGRQVYEANQRRNRQGNVEVGEVSSRDGYNNSYPTGNGQAGGYDVTYEYAGRTYRTRTNYHPGDRIRVRVDVRPE
ncbi:MAG TPA: glycine zipper 2TM domain-containing protein [Xanthomonadaceae bacterium]|nr:glycine zipper 2TM domain-containing protein [Xanthomonadaceae bacterium]